MSSTEPKPNNWRNYTVTKKFRAWAAPIVDNSYGNLTAEEVLEYLAEKKLKSTVLPLIEGGRQPIGPFGPCDRFQTKTHAWESNTPEYQKFKRQIFGLPEPKEEKPAKSRIVQTVGP